MVGDVEQEWAKDLCNQEAVRVITFFIFSIMDNACVQDSGYYGHLKCEEYHAFIKELGVLVLLEHLVSSSFCRIQKRQIADVITIVSKTVQVFAELLRFWLLNRNSTWHITGISFNQTLLIETVSMNKIWALLFQLKLLRRIHTFLKNVVVHRNLRLWFVPNVLRIHRWLRFQFFRLLLFFWFVVSCNRLVVGTGAGVVVRIGVFWFKRRIYKILFELLIFQNHWLVHLSIYHLWLFKLFEVFAVIEIVGVEPNVVSEDGDIVSIIIYDFETFCLFLHQAKAYEKKSTLP